MSSVEDLEKLRAKAQIKHGQTIRRLERAFTRDAFHWLVESHVMLVLKMSSSLDELVHRN